MTDADFHWRDCEGRRPLRWLGLCAAMLLLHGCGSPTPRRDAAAQVALPAHYRNADAARPSPAAADQSAIGALRAGFPATGEERLPQTWWRLFGSRTLERLVDQALANNRDLRIATIQVAQAKLRAEQVDADGRPRLSAPLQAAVQAPGGQVGAVPVSRSGSGQQTALQASLQGSWQIDLWGERQGMAESAGLQVWRALYERENVQRNLIANVVTGYINYLMANDAIRLARESEITGRGIVKVLEQRLAAGDATADEVEQKRAALYALQLSLPGLALQREEARSGIAMLVGSVASDVELPEEGIDSLSIPEIAAELPSTLLFRRPDIRAVEARMRAANADIGVARARMLPALNLSGQLGYSGLGVLQLLQPQNLFWNLISGMTASIFDGGRKQADKALSQANYEEMVETYARTVLQAVREVEWALANLRSSREQFALQGQMTGSGLKTYKMSEAGFSVGAVDSTGLLEARKGYQRYLEDEWRRKADVLKSNVTLYLALGAGSGSLSAGDPAGADPFAGLAAVDDAELFGDSLARATAGAGWQVALPGVYHQSVVPAVWRDLNARHPLYMAGRALRVRANGRVESADDLPQAWHQLAVTRFPAKEDADRFCRSLRSRQQQCSVEEAADGGVASPLRAAIELATGAVAGR